MLRNKFVKPNFNYFIWGIFFIAIHFGSILRFPYNDPDNAVYFMQILLPIFLMYVLLHDRELGKYSFAEKLSIALAVLMLLFGLISMAWTIDKNATIVRVSTYAVGFLYIFVLVRLIRDEYKFHRIIIANLLIMFAFMLVGIVESFTGIHFIEGFWDNIYSFKDIYYPVVVFGNPNNFIFVLIGLAPFINHATNKIFNDDKYIIGLMIRGVYCVLYIILAYLASCRMGLLLVPIYFWASSMFLKNKKISLAISILAVAATLVIDLHFHWFDELYNDSRVYIWPNIIANLKYYNYMGTGLGVSHMVIPGVNYPTNVMTNAHNIFVELLSEFGVIVFTVILGWLLYILVKNIHNGLNYDLNRNVSYRVAAKSIILLVPMSIMCSSAMSMDSFWMIIGLILIATNIKQSNYN